MTTRLLTCQCGCGTQFEQNGVGRVRKYLNSTHKSAANNARTREAIKQSLSLKGAVLLENITDNMEVEDIGLWFPDLTHEQWIVIEAIRSTPLSCKAFIANLMEMAKW